MAEQIAKLFEDQSDSCDLIFLMDRFAEEDGARLLQMYSMHTADAESALDQHCLHIMAKRIRNDTITLFARQAMKTAACFLSILILSSVLVFGLSAEARASVLRWIKQTDNQAVTYSPVVLETNPEEFMQYEISALPEEYVILDELSSVIPGVLFYENAEGSQISFFFQPPDGRGTLYLIPGEDEILPVSVNGIPADLYIAAEEGKSSNIVWTDPDTGYLLMVQGVLSQHELIALAQSVTRVDQ